MKNLIMHFGEWLRKYRIAAGLSQGKLAKTVSMHGTSLTPSYISNLERNYYQTQDGLPTKPNERIVDALAKALGKPVDEARLAAGYAPKTSIHFVNGFRIELPGDVDVMLAKSDDVRTQADADEFKEAFMVAYATVKARLARDRDEADE